jgi:hypothetical protein
LLAPRLEHPLGVTQALGFVSLPGNPRHPNRPYAVMTSPWAPAEEGAMRRAILGLVVVTALGQAAPAGAVEPVHFSLDPPAMTVQDPDACGFGVAWTIDLSVEGTRFFDQEGNLVRVQAHIKEENTITNLTTGLTLREGPDSFMQTTIINPDGSRLFIATGLAANVFGEQLKDVGRVVWLPGTNEIVFAAGPHSVREALEFGTFQDALTAFCDVLA